MSQRARFPMDLSVAQSVNPRRWMPTLAAGLSIGEYARSLMRRLAFLSAVLVAAIWALGGQGYLWPAWAWLGLGVLVLLDFAAGWAWRHPPGAVRRVACVWAVVGVGGGDPDVHVAVDVAARRGAHVLAGVGAARPGYGRQRVLADRTARPRARRPRPARVAREDRHADAHPPSGRRCTGSRAATHRARPARRRAGAAGRADTAAGTSRAARPEPARGPRADPRCPARGASRDRRAARPRARHRAAVARRSRPGGRGASRSLPATASARRSRRTPIAASRRRSRAPRTS